MSSTKTPKAEKSAGKEARHTIEKKLDLLLTDLKKELGDVKFKNRIKKAARLLSKGLKKEKKKVVKAAKAKPTKAKAPKTQATAAVPATELAN